MVTLARESRALTQTELAHRVNITQGMQSKCEADLKEPTDALVGKWAVELHYPEKFFYQTDPVFGAGLSEFYHRKRQDVPVRTLARVHAAINICRMHVARLLRSVEVEPSKIRPIDMDEYGSNPANVAREVRAMWNLPAGPVANLVTAIENAGGIVIRFPFGTSKIDAISRWVPGLPPLFFVNADLPTDRERLTLAHELGHIFMHDVPSATMEDEANKFAAEFLMPAKEVAPHLERVTLERLAVLKPYWRVSMQALLYRAVELGKVSRRTSQFLWMELAKRGYRRAEPSGLNLAPETPSALRELIDLHRNDFGYGVDEFAQMLATEPDELISLYGISQTQGEVRSTLRVVHMGERTNGSRK